MVCAFDFCCVLWWTLWGPVAASSYICKKNRVLYLSNGAILLCNLEISVADVWNLQTCGWLTSWNSWDNVKSPEYFASETYLPVVILKFMLAYISFNLLFESKQNRFHLFFEFKLNIMLPIYTTRRMCAILIIFLILKSIAIIQLSLPLNCIWS